MVDRWMELCSGMGQMVFSCMFDVWGAKAANTLECHTGCHNMGSVLSRAELKITVKTDHITYQMPIGL